MFSLFGKNKKPTQFKSEFFNEKTFYKAFIRDLERANSRVIIESPFITSSRAALFLPIFKQIRRRDVQVLINTRHPAEHELPMSIQAAEIIDQFQKLGIDVYYTGRLHRKIAISDSSILWEGSLSILSQVESSEIMRRLVSSSITDELLTFLGY